MSSVSADEDVHVAFPDLRPFRRTRCPPSPRRAALPVSDVTTWGSRSVSERQAVPSRRLFYLQQLLRDRQRDRTEAASDARPGHLTEKSTWSKSAPRTQPPRAPLSECSALCEADGFGWFLRSLRYRGETGGVKERVGLTDTHSVSRTRVTSGFRGAATARRCERREGRGRQSTGEQSRAEQMFQICGHKKTLKKDAPPRKAQQEDKKFQKNESCDANKKHFYRVSGSVTALRHRSEAKESSSPAGGGFY